MRFRHPVENYVVICLFAVASLLAAYGVISAVSSGVSPQPKPISVSSVANCSLPDKSFCSTELAFKTFVTNRDFSDILENQVPIDMTCSGIAKSQPYCRGVKDGLVVQLFQVHEGSTPRMLTRNGYISFFNSYSQQNGPFSLTNETTAKRDALITYTNQAGTKHYILTFQKAGSGWKLAYPTID